MNKLAFQWLVATVTILSLCNMTVHTTRRMYIIPNDSTECTLDVHPCYTISQVINQASYFESNTTIILLPGIHSVNSSGPIIIANVNNFILTGNDSDPPVIQCISRLGFGFINITNLTIKSIQFVKCGTDVSKEITQHRLSQTAYDRLYTAALYYPTLYLMYIMKVTISKVRIYESVGTGLFGQNVLGNSSISQSSFGGNNPNCVFMFSNNDVATETFTENILLVNDSEFISGLSSADLAAGITFIWEQTEFLSSVYINSVEVSNNTGSRNGNMLFNIHECSYRLVAVEVNELNCSNGRGKDAAGLSLNYGRFRFSPPNCISTTNRLHTTLISNSFFSDNNSTNNAAISIRFYSRDGIITLVNTAIYNSKYTGLFIFTPLLQKTYPPVVLDSVQFTNNEGALSVYNAKVTLKGNSSFVQNNDHNWAAVRTRVSVITFNENITFMRNIGYKAGAICAYDSSLEFKNITQFMENEGHDGGAISFHDRSIMIISKKALIDFIKNHAKHYGGAIYVEDQIDYNGLVYNDFDIQKLKCFCDLGDFQWNSDYLYRVLLEDNQADYAGSAIYGGYIDICENHSYMGIFNFNFQITTCNSSDHSVISSSPSRICICSNLTPNCSILDYNVTVYPGQTFQIPAVGVGQRMGVVSATAYSHILQISNSNTLTRLDSLQYAQETSTTCRNLSYTIKSSNNEETMILSAGKLDHIRMDLQTEDFEINPYNSLPAFRETSNVNIKLELVPCPLGFIIDTENISCICDPELEKHTVSCYIDTQRVHREKTLWINATFADQIPVGVLVHKHCPFDYCKPHSLNLSLENPDEQCAFHRSRILCGKCQHNFSHVLGSSNCRRCSNLLIFLTPAFALAGIGLVVFLMLLNLTVSTGTVNGLIFYANIVRSNQAVFFPSNTIQYSFPTHFIAWINLDFGIETCFYDGMDAYTKTWLQFIFPLYIWLIVILIIVFSHYRRRWLLSACAYNS